VRAPAPALNVPSPPAHPGVPPPPLLSSEPHEPSGAWCRSFHNPAPVELLVSPRSVAEVAAVVRLCAQRRIPITPRGAGTGIEGGCIPYAGGVVLCTVRSPSSASSAAWQQPQPLDPVRPCQGWRTTFSYPGGRARAARTRYHTYEARGGHKPQPQASGYLTGLASVSSMRRSNCTASR